MDQSDPSKLQTICRWIDLLRARRAELEKLRYSRRSLRRYRTVWRHLVAFSRQMNLGDEYSEDLAARFATRIGCVTANASSQASGGDGTSCSASRCLETLRVTGALSAPASISESIQVPALMKKPLREYEQYCRDRRHLRPTTLHERMHEIAVFADFLGSRNVTTLDQMQPADVSAFVTSRHRLAA